MRPTDELLQRMHFLEAILPARARDTARLEAELRDLKETLTGPERTRSGIRGAIEDALSGDPNPDPNRSVAPVEPIALGIQGNNGSNPFADGRIGSLAAGENLRLALASIKKDLGFEGLVKFIIQTAIETSCMGAHDVIAVAFETVRDSELSVQDVVRAATQAARNTRNTRNISVHEIMRPAVAIASEMGNEAPIIIKEVFVATSPRLNPSMLRSSLLSVLGCAMGMGMTYRDIKDLMKAFSGEVKYGALGRGAAEEQQKTFHLSTPLKTEDSNWTQPQYLQKLQPSPDSPDHGDTINPSLVQLADKSDLDFINDTSPGPSAQGDASTMLTRPPLMYSDCQTPSQYFNSCRPSAVPEPIPAKRSAGGEEVDDNDEARPSKKIKTELEDRWEEGR